MNALKAALSSRDSCDCPGNRGCQWFKCGQPGPAEHSYKCEVFYATAGNFVDDASSLVELRQLIAHVLGYSELPPHHFGRCGRLWTLAALQYRLRDGAMASSFALLLIPRPLPACVAATVHKLAKSEKPFAPRGHRILDANPFAGLGVGRRGVERKTVLTHILVAIWSAHACWMARELLGHHVDWRKWQYSHIVSPPDELLGSKGNASRVKKTRSVSAMMNKDLPTTTSPNWLVVNGGPSPPPLDADSGSTYSNVSKPATPTLLHPRPQSFAGFSRWEILSQTPPSSRPAPHRPLPTLDSAPSGLMVDRNAVQSKRNSIIMLEENGSTYSIANELPASPRTINSALSA